MSKDESLRTTVGDVGVHNTDMHVSAGRWATGTFVSGTTTWTGTAAFTVIGALIKITAGTTVTMGTTATATAIMSGNVVGDYIFASGRTAAAAALTVFCSANTAIVEFPAGASVIISAANSTAGKYYFQFISTPT